MYLKSIELENVRSLKSAKINFQKGINIISGVPGQGKSTILQSVILALTNKLEDSNISELKSWGAKKAKIDLSWVDDDLLLRTLYEIGSSANRGVFDGDAPNPKLTNTDAVNYLNKLIDPDLFIASAYAMQDETPITKVSSSKRRDLLKKLFNLSFIEQLDSIEKDSIADKEQITSLKAVNDFLTQKEYHIIEIPALPFSMDEKTTKLLKVKELEQDLVGFEKSEKEKLEVEKSISNVDTKVQAKITQRTLKSDELIALGLKGGDLEKKISTFDYEHDLAELMQNAPVMDEAENDTLKILRTEFDAIMPSRVKPFDETPLVEAEKELKETQVKIAMEEKSIALIEKGKCPECGTEFTESDGSSHRIQRDVLYTLEATLSGKITELKKDKKLIETMVQEQRIISEKRDRISDKINFQLQAMTTAKIAYEKSLESEKRNIDTLKQSHAMQIENIKSTMKSLADTIDSLDKEIKILFDEKTAFQERAKTLISYKDDIQTLQDEIHLLKTDIDLYDKAQKEIEFAIKKNKDIDIEKRKDGKLMETNTTLIDELEKHSAVLKEAKEFYRVYFPNYIIKKLLMKIQDNMNFFMAEVYHGRYMIKIEEDKKKTGIDILYGADDKWADIRNASGFEKVLLKISWMFGLMFLFNKKFLIIDEGDANAPVAYSTKLYKIIGDFSNKYLDQLIVISHKPEVRTFLRQEYNAIEFEASEGIIKELA